MCCSCAPPCLKNRRRSRGFKLDLACADAFAPALPCSALPRPASPCANDSPPLKTNITCHIALRYTHTQPLLEQQVVKSQGAVDDMYEPITPDDLVRKEWTEKSKCPDDIMATLLPYQAEG